MKYSLLTIFSGVLVVLIISGCKKNNCKDSERRRWILQSPMKIEPNASEIRLGDTLTLSIKIPYSNTDSRSNTSVNINGSTMSEFGIDFRLTNAVGTRLVAEGREQFKIIVEKGTSREYTSTRNQNTFTAEQDGFLYRAKVIPLKKGIAQIVNYRVEARMDNSCTLIDFGPVCTNIPNNYDMYYQYGISIGGGASEYFSSPNHYYIWVK